MDALWVSLKENIKCGTRLTDVVERQIVNLGKQNGYKIPQKDNILNSSLQNGLSILESQAQLHELSVGDPSRKIVEMIFHKAWKNTTTSNSNSNSSKPLKKVIRTVFRVRNTAQALEKFEMHRENVKKEACIQRSPRRHPRSVVDGNESMRFYVTTMRCCCCCCQSQLGTKVLCVHHQKVKNLCGDRSCCVCQMIEFHNSDEAEFFMDENKVKKKKKKKKKMKNERRAVIVCRIIGGESEDNDVMQFGLENFGVRNPNAVLPCFVLVLN